MKKVFRSKVVNAVLFFISAVLLAAWFGVFGWLVRDLHRHKKALDDAALTVEKNCFSDRIQFVQQALYYREAVQKHARAK